MWHPGPSPQASALVAECEAVLAGRYAEHLEEHECRPPAWAWVNLLAHGTPDDLRHAAALAGGTGGARPWRQARAYLAGEILGMVDQGVHTLRELQRDVLVPIELRLAAGATVGQPYPGDVVATVVAELETEMDAERRIRRRRQHRD